MGDYSANFGNTKEIKHFINDIRENTIADKMVPGCKKRAIEITGFLKTTFPG
jgi:hypothetical protein